MLSGATLLPSLWLSWYRTHTTPQKYLEKKYSLFHENQGRISYPENLYDQPKA